MEKGKLKMKVLMVGAAIAAISPYKAQIVASSPYKSQIISAL